jgi:hypothetical protein
LECHLPADSTTGDLLQWLDLQRHELIHVREVPTPLRDILAEMYSGGRQPAVEEVNST